MLELRVNLERVRNGTVPNNDGRFRTDLNHNPKTAHSCVNGENHWLGITFGLQKTLGFLHPPGNSSVGIRFALSSIVFMNRDHPTV